MASIAPRRLKRQQHANNNNNFVRNHLNKWPNTTTKSHIDSSTKLFKAKKRIALWLPLSTHFYYAAFIILFTLILHYGFMLMPKDNHVNGTTTTSDQRVTTSLAETPLFNPTSENNFHQPSPPHKQLLAAETSNSSLLPESSHRPEELSQHHNSLLLNVPFYIYQDLYWLDEGYILVGNDNDNRNNNITIQYWIENIQEVKHTDDYWFAKSAMIHPHRTIDPSQAKLFIVPTLLNVIVDLIEVHNKMNHVHQLCFQNKCNLELMNYVNDYLNQSYWFQLNHGHDHIMVASHWASEWYVARNIYPSLQHLHVIGWENRNWNRDSSNSYRSILPKLCVGQPCPSHNDSGKKTDDFAMIASMHPERPMFASRSNICDWMMKKMTTTRKNQKSSSIRNNQNQTITTTMEQRSSYYYKMTACGPGPQCPALQNARFGFHVPGDTYGSNRIIDTLLSGTVPIFTFQQQYDVLPDWIDWNHLSYFANVSNEEIFLSNINTILADTQGYQDKHRNVIMNQDLFDWKKKIIPFDTYLYMLSVHLWPELEMQRRRTQNVTSPYSALIIPTLQNEKDDEYDNGEIMTMTTRPIFRVFDYNYKNVYCGGANHNARTCDACQYTNGKKQQGNSSRREYWKQALSDYYWTPNLNFRTWWKWESDPRACGGSCLWTGTKCVHRSQVVI